MKDVINIMVPGGFKPVHAGHIDMIKSYLDGDPDHDTNVHVIISNKCRDGITATSSYNFLTKVFEKYPNFHCMITSDKSPIYTVYNMTAMKEFGDGLYAMGTSAKNSDQKRQIEYNTYFAYDGKYRTPGVKPLMLIPESITFYKNRNDEYNGSPISSFIVRQDIMNDDYASFLSAYDTTEDIIVDENLLKEYYDELREEISIQLNETAAAGRINHPYDDNTLTFSEIKNMINDLFHGNIKDITEKIDGINILASMDDDGNTIFARNKKHLLNSPMRLNDIIKATNWNEKTRNSFINGAKTIEKVFSNIKGGTSFFNYDDKADGLRYRNWISCEIVDHSNMNVIPYADNFVSFHDKIITVCHKYFPKDEEEKSMFADPNIETDTYKLEKAIKDTNLSDDEFGAMMTPRMILKNQMESTNYLQDCMNDLIDLMDEYGLNDSDTVADYKYKSYFKYLINNNPIKYLTKDEMSKIAERWSGRKKMPVKDIFSNHDEDGVYKLNMRDLVEYEKSGLTALRRRVMNPFDKLFINIGNNALKLFNGGKNAGNEESVIKKIKSEIIDAIGNIQETGDENALNKLEYLLFRLGDTVDVNASEGIVFKYHGRFYKLTGSFSVLNQIVNMSRKIK